MKRVFIKGAGDLATGIACRLIESGFSVVLSDISVPTTVRRTVAFSPAVYKGEAFVEGKRAVFCSDIEKMNEVLNDGDTPVVVDTEGKFQKAFCPEVVVDAIIAKKNLGTNINDAKIVIAVGPGFTAGVDCHCVVESMRGHNLGRCIYNGSAMPNTGVPGEIGGFSKERIIRATADGEFRGAVEIGNVVKAGDVVGYVGQTPVYAAIDGVVRGLLQDLVMVNIGMKAGDIDPRCAVENCFSVSDKARSIGGGVLEAILKLSF